MNKYIRFNEISNALDYLEKGAFYIKRVSKNKGEWKWVVISLHGALYGFAICATQGTNYQNVLNKKKYPSDPDKLINFGKAIEYCKNNLGNNSLKLTKDQERAINMLHANFRNVFQHYIPKLWSIEIHGFPNISINVLDVIKFLALNPSVLYRLSTTQQRKIKSLIFQSKKALKNSNLFKEAELLKTHNKSIQRTATSALSGVGSSR